MRQLGGRLDRCSINTATLGYQDPIEQTIEAVAAAGFGAIAPWRRELEGRSARDVARRIRDAGLKVSGYCRSTYIPAVAAPGDGVIVINGATVIHPEREGADAVSPDTTILIRDGRIEAVLPRAAIELPQGATVIDGRGKYVIPGLVDSHVHFFQSGNLYTRPDAADFNTAVRYADEDARNKARLPATFRTWLRSGVTSVADVGGPFWNFTVRDAASLADAAPRPLAYVDGNAGIARRTAWLTRDESWPAAPGEGIAVFTGAAPDGEAFRAGLAGFGLTRIEKL